MGYFPNGTAGAAFVEAQCVGCMNYQNKQDGRGPGCAVWDVHLLFCSDQCGDDPKSKAIANILDVLIPRSKDGLDNTCAMRLDDGKDHKTLPLFGGVG